MTTPLAHREERYRIEHVRSFLLQRDDPERPAERDRFVLNDFDIGLSHQWPQAPVQV